MESLRAKFRVGSVEEQFDAAGNKTAENVQLSPVYSSDPNSENHSFSKYTPGGSLQMYITNPNAFGFYVGGKEYYLDLSPAPEPATA